MNLVYTREYQQEGGNKQTLSFVGLWFFCCFQNHWKSRVPNKIRKVHVYTVVIVLKYQHKISFLL